MYSKIITLLSQRRIWAGIAGVIVMLLNLMDVDVGFNATNFVDAGLKIIEAIGSVAIVILPIWSYLKPKIAAKK